MRACHSLVIAAAFLMAAPPVNAGGFGLMAGFAPGNAIVAASRNAVIRSGNSTAKHAAIAKAKPDRADQNRDSAPAAASAKETEDQKADSADALKEAPPVPGNILEIVESSGQFKTFMQLLKTSGFTAMLQGQGNYTLFAPTDKAFARFSAAQLQNLQRPENRAQLAQILGHHIIGGKKLGTDDLKKAQKSPETMAGQTLAFSQNKGRQQIDIATVIGKPMPGSNGIIHAIDLMLVPMPIVATTPPAEALQQSTAKQDDAVTARAKTPPPPAASLQQPAE